MPIVIEDGTGLSAALSYQSAADVSVYLTARGLGTTWTTLSVAEQDIACVLATDYLDNRERFQYRGARTIDTQALQWPRIGAIDDDRMPLQGVPVLIRRAHAELCGVLASRAGASGLTPQVLQPALARGGQIVSQSGAGFSQTFASNAPTETTYVALVGLLKTLLTNTSNAVLPYMTFVDDAHAFLPD